MDCDFESANFMGFSNKLASWGIMIPDNTMPSRPKICAILGKSYKNYKTELTLIHLITPPYAGLEHIPSTDLSSFFSVQGE